MYIHFSTSGSWPFLQVEILWVLEKNLYSHLSRQVLYKDRVRKCELHCLLNSFVSSGIYTKQIILTKHFLPPV